MMFKRLLVAGIGARNALSMRRLAYRGLRGLIWTRHVSSVPVSAVTLFSQPDKHVFFGYYDVTPFSSDDEYLLATCTPLDRITPTPCDALIVGYYTLGESSQVFVELGRTTTWCWQQGCRLQWYPSDSTGHVLYNRLVDGRYGCVIQNIHTGAVVQEHSRALYCVSHDGRWGLSLDFSRLQRLRPGYGYTTLPDVTIGESVPQDNGIWRIDMKTGEETLLFSLQDIAALSPKPSMQLGDHYFNVPCLNPKGDRFMFLHLCEHNGRRSGRLLTAGLDGEDIHLLENERTVSHYTWRTDKELLVTAWYPGSEPEYLLYNDDSGQTVAVGRNVLKQDGHPSYFSDRECIVTDTYPDKAGYYRILVYDDLNKNLRRLASFHSPVDFNGETRCDLHPRLNKDGTMLCADIVHRSRRALWTCRFG